MGDLLQWINWTRGHRVCAYACHFAEATWDKSLQRGGTNDESAAKREAVRCRLRVSVTPCLNLGLVPRPVQSGKILAKSFML